MVRVLGIDPGSGSWDILGFDESDGREDIFLDISIPTKKVFQEPEVLLQVIERNQPLDVVVAPSGHGIPLKEISQITDQDIAKANLRRNKDPSIMGIARVLHALRDARIKGFAIPGVKQLGSVKPYLKYNKIDMGTADKVCCVAAAIVDQAHVLGIPYHETGFILVEVGIGFNAVLAVERGKIVDGIGGSLGGMGFTAAGALDGEVAYLLDHVSKHAIYGGGLSSIAGHTELSPQELFLMARKDERINQAVQGFFHDMVKDVMSLVPSFERIENVKEIIISGRASQDINEGLSPLLPHILHSPARIVSSIARVSKTAAQGAAFIANGLARGKYQSLVDTMALVDSNHDLLEGIFVGPLSPE
nr:DUF1464 family protein [Candidatus Sigynarchaeota archaeon]